MDSCLSDLDRDSKSRVSEKASVLCYLFQVCTWIWMEFDKLFILVSLMNLKLI